MALGPRQFIGHIKAVPGVIQPRFSPGVAGQMLAILAVQIPRHITRRNPETACASQKRVSMILANTRTPGEGLGGAGVDLGGPRRVGHVLIQAVHQIDQRCAITPLLAGFLSERA
ncbi:hypothetical protein D3C78_1437200 [compost metagenome]